MWNIHKSFLFQVGLVVVHEAEEVASRGKEDGPEAELQAREEIFWEGVVAIREQNTTAEILCYQLCMYRLAPS